MKGVNAWGYVNQASIQARVHAECVHVVCM